jgi:hypothetical protein
MQARLMAYMGPSPYSLFFLCGPSRGRAGSPRDVPLHSSTLLSQTTHRYTLFSSGLFCGQKKMIDLHHILVVLFYLFMIQQQGVDEKPLFHPPQLL